MSCWLQTEPGEAYEVEVTNGQLRGDYARYATVSGTFLL